MYDAEKIIPGLIVFLIIVLFPYYYTMGRVVPPPKPVKPVKYKECVETMAYMRAAHMDLLNHWRNEVVRHENRVYIDSRGKRWNMSLQNECLKCHNNKSKFCDRCHNYVGVKPYCWDCHFEPSTVKKLPHKIMTKETM